MNKIKGYKQSQGKQLASDPPLNIHSGTKHVQCTPTFYTRNVRYSSNDLFQKQVIIVLVSGAIFGASPDMSGEYTTQIYSFQTSLSSLSSAMLKKFGEYLVSECHMQLQALWVPCPVHTKHNSVRSVRCKCSIASSLVSTIFELGLFSDLSWPLMGLASTSCLKCAAPI